MTKLEQLQLKVQILNITTNTKWWLTNDKEGELVLCSETFPNPEFPFSAEFDSVNQALALQWKLDAGKKEQLIAFLESTVKEDLK